ncbi:MAG: thioredoxin-dependent thiol peroxidase [Helicobacteraceae bacterium]|jgi:peroxiredoxin Q/BCP|nr:thioredoxin-dependent thiol peroxidase [Helicobacteraceae bacterium]
MAEIALKVGEKAPDFALLNQDGAEIALADFSGKWVVLYFYPKDSTSGCTKEACDFTAGLKDFEREDSIVLGVSPDSVKSHAKFIDKQNLAHTLLADTERVALTAYGVWREKSMYGRKYMGVARTTFLIDPQGKIAFIWEKVSVTNHAAIVLEKLRSLK